MLRSWSIYADASWRAIYPPLGPSGLRSSMLTPSPRSRISLGRPPWLVLGDPCGGSIFPRPFKLWVVPHRSPNSLQFRLDCSSSTYYNFGAQCTLTALVLSRKSRGGGPPAAPFLRQGRRWWCQVDRASRNIYTSNGLKGTRSAPTSPRHPGRGSIGYLHRGCCGQKPRHSISPSFPYTVPSDLHPPLSGHPHSGPLPRGLALGGPGGSPTAGKPSDHAESSSGTSLPTEPGRPTCAPGRLTHLAGFQHSSRGGGLRSPIPTTPEAS